MTVGALHDITVMLAFFAMLFSPVVSATYVSMRWDKAEAAYLRFEAQVERMMNPNRVVVPSNLCIRPYSAWARFHVEAEPLESASLFRLRVFSNGKLAAAAQQSKAVAAAVEVPLVQSAAA